MSARDSGLFIGGPWDGQRRAVSTDHSVTVQIAPEMPRSVENSEFFVPTTVTYRRGYISARLVWFDESLSPEDVVDRLLEHYRPEPSA